MGPCQGRMCQLAGIGVCARETGRSMAETGVTTSRPPNPSVSLGALAGPRHHPIRRTPMHYAHQESGAVWLDMGEWKRPRYYKSATCSSERQCVEEEYRAVRERVGLIDVSTLGKLDVKGRDAGKLLDKVYTDRFSDLKPGRVRYSVLCDEAGIILDDGTISRLADDHYFITTTTGNLDFVQQVAGVVAGGQRLGCSRHEPDRRPRGGKPGGPPGARRAQGSDGMRPCGQCVSIHGLPRSRCGGRAVAAAAYWLCRRNRVGDPLPGRIRRISLGEAGRGRKNFGIRPFGVEAQRLLRLEKRHVIVGVDTDALSSPYEAGMAWVAKLDKPDFIGRNALARLAQTAAATEPGRFCDAGRLGAAGRRRDSGGGRAGRTRD